ncbi:MAG TPA: hypothetical protein VGD43_20135, partial [Micromonospora sp.]
LRLGPDIAPDGFRERRVYRILVAGELDGARLAELRRLWRMEPGGDPADPRTRVVGSARRRLGDDHYVWELRRIGGDVAWSVDLTVCLAGTDDTAVGLVLAELRAALRRQHGLIPVTVERFS